jgi:hypothetical protein
VPARPQACLSPIGRSDIEHQRVCLRRTESLGISPCDTGASLIAGSAREHQRPPSA